MKKVRLNNGLEMPQLGIGVYALKSDEAEFAVKTALQNGYRLIDTANVYMNEKAVGRGLRASGVKREDVFISSKLWPQDYAYEKAKKAIDKTLERLGVDYIDLLLLHQQYGPYLEAWKAMEEAVKEGKVRSIGLSDFNAKRFQDVIDHAEISSLPPSGNHDSIYVLVLAANSAKSLSRTFCCSFEVSVLIDFNTSKFFSNVAIFSGL